MKKQKGRNRDDQTQVVKIQAINSRILIAEKCVVAESFWDRLIGLVGRKSLMPEEGLLFPQCKSVHMWFMRFPIDVVFLSEQKTWGRWRVIGIHAQARPWKALPLTNLRATATLELAAGAAERYTLKVGDELCIA